VTAGEPNPDMHSAGRFRLGRIDDNSAETLVSLKD
jgi:hypothetical protein